MMSEMHTKDLFCALHCSTVFGFGRGWSSYSRYHHPIEESIAVAVQVFSPSDWSKSWMSRRRLRVPCRRNTIWTTTLLLLLLHIRRSFSFSPPSCTLHQSHRTTAQLLVVGSPRSETRRSGVLKGTRTTRTEPNSASKKRPQTSKGAGAAATEAKAPKNRKKRAAAKKGPPFWTVANDTFIYAAGEDDTDLASGNNTTSNPHFDLRHVQFSIRGNPLPLRRHRTSRGFMYNPSAKAQECFRNLVQELLNTTTLPLFPATATLAVTLHFRMQRPLSHWKASRRGHPGGLRNSTSSMLHAGLRTDVDNLAKFVLDTLNNIAYADDRQVVSLHVSKVYDNVEDCRGSTVVCIRRLDTDEEMQRVLKQSLQLGQ